MFGHICHWVEFRQVGELHPLWCVIRIPIHVVTSFFAHPVFLVQLLQQNPSVDLIPLVCVGAVTGVVSLRLPAILWLVIRALIRRCSLQRVMEVVYVGKGCLGLVTQSAIGIVFMGFSIVIVSQLARLLGS